MAKTVDQTNVLERVAKFLKAVLVGENLPDRRVDRAKADNLLDEIELRLVDRVGLE